MAKSEICTIDVRHEPENRIVSTNACETDVAISILPRGYTMLVEADEERGQAEEGLHLLAEALVTTH